MIPNINNLQNLEKLFRKYLIKQSDLNSSQVINSLSIRGPELIKIINAEFVSPINLLECVLLFEISYNDTNNNVSMVEEDGTITLYNSYKINLISYGLYSKTLMSILKARFESSIVRYDLHTEGIYLENVSNIESINEFVNETLWERSDLSIEFSCRLSILQNSNPLEFENLNSIILDSENLKKEE